MVDLATGDSLDDWHPPDLSGEASDYEEISPEHEEQEAVPHAQLEEDGVGRAGTVKSTILWTAVAKSKTCELRLLQNITLNNNSEELTSGLGVAYCRDSFNENRKHGQQLRVQQFQHFDHPSFPP